MRKNFLLLLLAAMFTMVSCNYNEVQVTVNTTEADQEAIVDGKVPLSRAITNANFVFKNIEGASLKNRKVKSVDVLTTSNTRSVIANTRSGLGEQEQPVAYVVNYDNNEGFAILAADTNLPPVIGIGDEGNFNTQGFIDFVRGKETRTNGAEINPAQEVQYAIINNSLFLPPIIDGPSPTGCVDTTIVLKCLPLVRTKWGQEDPYNRYAPPVQGAIFESKSKAGCVPVAGAQVLTSLCYHHNLRPTTQLSEQYIVDWEALNSMIFNNIIEFEPDTYSSDIVNVARLIRAVGHDVGALYGSETQAHTYDLADTYEKLGISSTRYGNEESDIPITRDDIFNMIIYKNFPVIVSARSYEQVGSTDTDGHSFVLDGWLRLEYSSVSVDGNMSGNTTIINRQHNFDLVHVNFGWNGRCDGYYLPDAFDLTTDKYREYAELDDDEYLVPYVFDIDVEYLIYEI